MIGNIWFDRSTGVTTYNIEDPNYKLLTEGAVSMAGHSGKAFWFSKSTNEFVTSSYYYKKYPQ